MGNRKRPNIIPEDGKIKEEDVVRRPGFCFWGCNWEFQDLKIHFRNHQGQAKPPYRYKYDFIPLEGDWWEEDDFAAGDGGWCLRGCNKYLNSHLNRHWRLVHPNGEITVPKKDVIPENGDITVEELTSRGGYCGICDKPRENLKNHFRYHQAMQMEVEMEGDQTIPADGKVNEEDLTPAPGRCLICNTGIHNLKIHFQVKHLKWTHTCPICGVRTSARSSSVCDHADTHSGPARCSVCLEETVSVLAVKTHIKRHHPEVKGAHAVKLSPAEVIAFRESQALKEEFKATRWGEQGTPISEPKTRMPQVELLLKQEGHYLAEKVQLLQAKFAETCAVPTGTVIAANAAFYSCYNIQWKCPQLLLEIVSRRVGERWNCSAFCQDPKADCLSQPQDEDYRDSGYHRGHLASAADFTDELLVLNTYLYTNVVPMTPKLNCRVRIAMERFIRHMADRYGEVTVLHFPVILPNSNPEIIGKLRKIVVPPSVATVLIYQVPDGAVPIEEDEEDDERVKPGLHVMAWELFQTDIFYEYCNCTRNPFRLLEKVGITFKLPREAFRTVSEDFE